MFYIHWIAMFTIYVHASNDVLLFLLLALFVVFVQVQFISKKSAGLMTYYRIHRRASVTFKYL